MKAKATIRREVQRLMKISQDDTEDDVSRRVAWEVAHALRWVLEPVKGWPNRSISARECAGLIRSDLQKPF